MRLYRVLFFGPYRAQSSSKTVHESPPSRTLATIHQDRGGFSASDQHFFTLRDKFKPQRMEKVTAL
ncbi:MAG TPA: hypothetical protein VFQ06_05800, partial [Nitrospira sp.]|nr:hypothetical protein [Nitrospira sp.]